MRLSPAPPDLARHRVRSLVRGAGTPPETAWFELTGSEPPSRVLARLVEQPLPDRHWVVIAGGEAAGYAAELAEAAALPVAATGFGSVVDCAAGDDRLIGLVDGLGEGGATAVLLLAAAGVPAAVDRLRAGDAGWIPADCVLCLLVRGGDPSMLVAGDVEGIALLSTAGAVPSSRATVAPDVRRSSRWLLPARRWLPVALVTLACAAALVAVGLRSRSGASPAPASATAVPTTSAAPEPLHSGPAPQARTGPASTWDAVHGRLVLFGGTGRGDPIADLGDTWTWDGGAWRAEAPRHRPPPRFGGLLAPVARGVLLVGGSHRVAQSGALEVQPLDDAWLWDGQDWTQVIPGPPVAAGEHAQALSADPSSGDGHGVLLLAAAPDRPSPTAYTWDGTAWSVRHASTAAPQMRLLCADPARRQVLGISAEPTRDVSATWVWRSGDWHMLSPAQGVEVDPLTALVADDLQNGTVLLVEEHFAADGGSPSPTDDRGGTWVWNGSTWTQVPGPVPGFVLAFGTTAPAVGEPSGRLTLLGGSFGSDAYLRWSGWNPVARRWVAE